MNTVNGISASSLQATLASARHHLLSARNQQGHWQGQLSPSALSTAIAVAALSAYQQHAHTTEDFSDVIEQGLQWLASTQNEDGGWGDTTLSFSNISTTSICWAAFAIVGADQRFTDAMSAAERWLENTAGGLQPKPLAAAIAARYGKDRTFSVPILMTLAIAGRLGPERNAWRLVPQLPFELAACPYRWFQWLQLPVVSYALPALIAIGQLRHHQLPTSNPLTRMIRQLTRRRTLRVLRAVQPTSGGFLEATPLTSFVVLSLVHSGSADHAVSREGVRFLRQSVLADGSWPIDTNLATWVTTLSVNALANHPPSFATLDVTSRQQIATWLLDQQYHVEHPYTHAPPGAWAWTDLTGGVPDADDTPGALLAISALTRHPDPAASTVELRAAEAGVQWLLDLQNRDGGIPTFCRGWGNLPFDRSSADLTAHALRAWLAWQSRLAAATQQRIDTAIDRALGFLAEQQRDNGSWVPLWFGNQFTRSEENPTYGTTRVLLIVEAAGAKMDVAARLDLDRSITWLLSAQNDDGGWGGDVGTPSSIEETAFAVEALGSLLLHHTKSVRGHGEGGHPAPPCQEPPGQDELSWEDLASSTKLQAALAGGVHWLMKATSEGSQFPPSPIGFYFAKLWYFETLYPLVFTVAALGRVACWLEEGVDKMDAMGDRELSA